MAEARTLTGAQARTRLQALFRAFNEHDVEKITALHTPDAVLEDPNLATPARGREAITAELTRMFRAFPDVNFPLDELDVYVGTGGRVAARWHMTATMTGPADPPGFAPTGRKVSLPGVCLYEFHEGLVSHHTILYDSVAMLRQLGLMPGPQSLVTRLTAGAQRTAAWAVGTVRGRWP